MYLQDFMWKLFQSTGAINAYLTYRQLKQNQPIRLSHLKQSTSVDVHL